MANHTIAEAILRSASRIIYKTSPSMLPAKPYLIWVIGWLSSEHCPEVIKQKYATPDGFDVNETIFSVYEAWAYSNLVDQAEAVEFHREYLNSLCEYRAFMDQVRQAQKPKKPRKRRKD